IDKAADHRPDSLLTRISSNTYATPFLVPPDIEHWLAFVDRQMTMRADNPHRRAHRRKSRRPWYPPHGDGRDNAVIELEREDADVLDAGRAMGIEKGWSGVSIHCAYLRAGQLAQR